MYTILTIVLIAFIFGIMYTVRLFSNATTANPKPGITCATMVTGEGVAISCWKD